MSALTDAQSIGVQLEKVRDKVSTLFAADSTLFSRIAKRDNVEVVSSRNMRIPLKVLNGGVFKQVNMDGGDLGRGSGATYVTATCSPYYFSQAVEITKQAEIDTNKKEKAVENVVKDAITDAMQNLRSNIESLLNSDGSGTLCTITAVSGSTLTVDNANALQDGQPVQLWSALGGSQRGTGDVTVLSTDANARQVALTAAAPTGTAAGDIVVVSGGSATAASSLYGIGYHHVDSGIGTWMGLNRASYPGKLKTPHVSGEGNAINQLLGRAALSAMKRALGADNKAVKSLVWHCGLDQEAAVENIGTAVSQVFQNQISGDSSLDMLKAEAPKTFAGHEMVVSIKAKPGRMDGLCLDHWGRAESQPIDYYEIGGQTVFPLYGQSGGLAASQIFYFVTGFQVFNDNPRAGTFIDNLKVPENF